MFANASLLQQSVAVQGLRSHDRTPEARRRAASAFDKAQTVGFWSRLVARMLGRSTRLLDLNEVAAQGAITHRSYAGVRLVPIAAIRGSENRVEDFDSHFHPVSTHTMDRWVSVAVAFQLGVSLPPVDLVQVGDSYYVRDGHHRISVARHMGQQEIEAEVTVWQQA